MERATESAWGGVSGVGRRRLEWRRESLACERSLGVSFDEGEADWRDLRVLRSSASPAILGSSEVDLFWDDRDGAGVAVSDCSVGFTSTIVDSSPAMTKRLAKESCPVVLVDTGEVAAADFLTKFCGRVCEERSSARESDEVASELKSDSFLRSCVSVS